MGFKATLATFIWVHTDTITGDIEKSSNMNGVDVTEKREIGDYLNLYFSTVGKK